MPERKMKISFVFAGCVRLQGGLFYAKKKPNEEPQIKEAHLDTNQLLPGRKDAPGSVEFPAE